MISSCDNGESRSVNSRIRVPEYVHSDASAVALMRTQSVPQLVTNVTFIPDRDVSTHEMCGSSS